MDTLGLFERPNRMHKDFLRKVGAKQTLIKSKHMFQDTERNSRERIQIKSRNGISVAVIKSLRLIHARY